MKPSAMTLSPSDHPRHFPTEEELPRQVVRAAQGRGLQKMFAQVIGYLFAVVWLSTSALGQDIRELPPNKFPPFEPIALKDLPAPTSKIQQLLERANVTMKAGDRDPSVEPSLGIKIAAETQFKMRYEYRSFPQWAVKDGATSRILNIRLRFRRLRLVTDHEIWFRTAPTVDEFWKDPLVLHELDHVKISSDSRLAKRFESLVQSETVLRRPIERGQTVNAAMVRKIVDQHVAQAFEKVSDLVSVRYRELDRLTRHGRDPVPPKFADQYLTGR